MTRTGIGPGPEAFSGSERNFALTVKVTVQMSCRSWPHGFHALLSSAPHEKKSHITLYTPYWGSMMVKCGPLLYLTPRDLP